MKITTRLKKWNDLGYDEATIARLLPAVEDINFIVMLRAALVLSIVGIVGLIFYIFSNSGALRIITAIICIAVNSSVFIAGRVIISRNIALPTAVKSLLIYFVGYVSCLGTAFLGTFMSDNDLAVSFVFMLLLIQLLVDRRPSQNMIIVLPCFVVFTVCAAMTKSSTPFSYDILHSSIAIVLGASISRSKTRMRIDNLIAEEKLLRANYDLYHSSVTDELTGLPNRRRSFARFAELLRGQKSGALFCLVLDVDDFKGYNDMYGHPAGDELLRTIGRILNEYEKTAGISPGRIGGEEFIAVWACSSAVKGQALAESIRASLGDKRLVHAGSCAAPYATFSGGLSMSQSGAATTFEKLYSEADRALYQAKGNGKNCCYFSNVSEYTRISSNNK